jgi:xylulose-5-phosphate/fructose-6-phosphate phosphoketolase
MQAQESHWRQPIGSLNYIETSTWTRQEHNGFSHQNPSFIGAVLNLKPNAARVYFPPDANCFLSTLAHCLRSKNYVNLMVGSKQPSPVFLGPQEAESHCRAGASIFEFASTDKGINPDVVLVGIGAELTFEVVKAAEMLKEIAPELRVRVANVTDLMVLETEGVHPHALTNQDYDSLFTSDRNIHFNYHGYATELKGLLFARPNVDRVTVEGYREEGSTTTPFDMMLVNHVSRYHVMEYALRGGAKVNEKIRVRLVPLLADLKHRIQKTREYIFAEGKDLDDTYDLNKVKGSGGGVLSEG